MPDPASIDAVRAAADAMLPPTDGRPGAADLGIERHIVHQVEGIMAGFTDLIATLLDAYAAGVRSDAGFASLSPDQRRLVLRTMYGDDSQDVREIVDTIQVFAIGGMYSEWARYDPETRRLERPAVWDDVGYHGPADGIPDYRVDV